MTNTLWYLGPQGMAASDQRLPRPIPNHVRARYLAPQIPARRDNGWMVWASAFNAQNTRSPARAYVVSLDLFAVDSTGRQQAIYQQRYRQGGPVWGGWFRYTDTGWYIEQVAGQDTFSVKQFVDRGITYTGALIDTGAWVHVPAAGHIWQMTWPRKLAPANAVKLRVTATFKAEGNTLINVGLDRYRTSTQDPVPVQEVMVSDTYAAEHGLVTVKMTTGRIAWT